MIESITVKKFASYDNDGANFDSLRKINFIYGANGSGKTTVSNLLASPDGPYFTECEVSWKGGHQLKTQVYNKKFREENFGKGTIEGVFTLGQATKEEVDLIENKTKELSAIKDEGIKLKGTLENQKEKKNKIETTFKENAWLKVYKKYELSFKEAFVGFMQKEKFKEKLLSESSSNKSELLNLDDLKEKSKTIFGESPVEMLTIQSVNYDEILIIEGNKLWKKKIIGKSDVDISELIRRLNIDDWVHQGIGYLQESEICPFCQQNTISAEFRKKLESYFEDSYTNEVNEIKTLSGEYSRKAENIINELAQIEFREKSNQKSKLNLDKFSSFFKTLNSQFRNNIELLNGKNKEPSRVIELVSTKEQLEVIMALIAEANSEVENHNKIVKDYASERAKLISTVWRYLVSDYFVEIGEYNKTISGFNAGIDKLEKNTRQKRKVYNDLNEEINKLNENVTSVEPTIIKINKTLKTFGFSNFEIFPSDLNQ